MPHPSACPHNRSSSSNSPTHDPGTDPISIYTDLMADQLLDTYWESLGKNGVFLCVILANQEQCLQQLQQQNQYLQTQLMATQSGVVNTASTATAAMAQNLVIPASVTGMALT